MSTQPIARSGVLEGFAARFRRANPVFKREITQAGRLTRTPWILLGITLSVAFVLCATGGISADSVSPGEVGELLFHTFFSIAAAVVAIAGPSLSANAIAAEREGRTWEALQLTGMPVTRIARGKFLASFADIALYIVVLAPVGALCSIFGGVTGAELGLAFAFLLAFAALTVSFGLAMSSLMQSSRGAILVTLFGAIFIASFLYFVLGVGGSVLSSHVLGGFKEGAPIWVPLAIMRGDFGLSYVLLAIVAPLAALLLPAWFLYELAVSNLESPQGDRASRMKVWFLTTSTVVAGLAATIPFAAKESARLEIGLVTQVGVALYLIAAPLLFVGEADEASPLLRATWAREGTSRLRQLLGPSHLRAQAMSAVVGTGVWAVTVGASALATTSRKDAGSALLSGLFLIPFMVFHAALSTYWRARSQNAWMARVCSVAVGIGLTAVPWVFVAMAGITRSSDEWLAFGAPSPVYAAVLLAEMRRSYPSQSTHEIMIFAAAVTSAAYLTGAALFTSLAISRTRRVAAEKRAMEASNEAAFSAR